MMETILQNIFCIQQKKYIHLGLKQLEVNDGRIFISFLSKLSI